MGTATLTPRLVLDTNTVVSALLFRDGRLGWLRRAWQAGRLTPVVCRATMDELLRVLTYPKFRLERDEIAELLADFVPYTELVEPLLDPGVTPRCRDPHDQIFIDLAVASGADGLISGDGDLLALAADGRLSIRTPAALRAALGAD
jgi:uncharacterized protein